MAPKQKFDLKTPKGTKDCKNGNSYIPPAGSGLGDNTAS